MRFCANSTAALVEGFFAIALVLNSAPPARACLGGYRGPDWQVGNSPLILIGAVEKIEAGKVASAATYRTPFESNGESHRVPPTIATVRIIRLLKGEYADARIRIGGGPIHSCCDDDWFYSFEVGEQKLFILPYHPVNGEVALEWSGSIRELAMTSMIESRIARAVAFRDAYLADLRREQPRVYAAGAGLAQELRQSAETWPDRQYDDKTGKVSDDFKKALAGLRGKLVDVDVEAIRAALAIDWLANDAGYWPRKRLWRELISRIETSRTKEIGVAEERWIRRTLARAGVEDEQIRSYVAAVQKAKQHGQLCFPHESPTDWSYFHRDYVGGAEILTTDFILRYHSYDRGAMLHTYAGTLDASCLGGLDPKRIKPWVTSLYHNDDERLRWLSQQVIGRVRGTAFVGLVLDDMVDHGHPWAWRVLDHYDGRKETAACLAAMIDLAEKERRPREFAAMWDALRHGECLEDICIKEAIAALRNGERNGPQTESAKEDHEVLSVAIRRYLATAMASREPVKPPEFSPAEYRQWFKDHLAPKKDE